MRRSDALSPTPSPFVAFPRWSHTVRPSFAPDAVGRDHAGLGLVTRFPVRDFGWKRPGLPRSWGTRTCLCRVLRPRQDRSRQAVAADRRGRRPVNDDDSCVGCFRGSIARPRHSLSPLRRSGCPEPTPDSLPAAGQALRGGIGYPLGSNEGFPKWSYIFFLPSQVCVAQ